MAMQLEHVNCKNCDGEFWFDVLERTNDFTCPKCETAHQRTELITQILLRRQRQRAGMFARALGFDTQEARDAINRP